MDIIASYAKYTFVPSGYFAFDASEETIHYDEAEIQSNKGKLSLLHEVSHAELGHFTFSNDFELLIMEAQAWHLTKRLCNRFDVPVDDAYIQECINSYDHWLSTRSSCPHCYNFCLPTKDPHTFRCFLCGCSWQASANPHEAITLTVLSAQPA